MRAQIARSLIAMVVVLERRRLLRVDILIERAALRDVEHLHAAADAQHRLLILDGDARQRQLRVALRSTVPSCGIGDSP